MKVKFDIGTELDVVTNDELDGRLKQTESVWTEYARGLKHVRLPILRATVSNSGTVTLGGADDPSGVICGPAQGWAWRVTRISVFGLTQGTSQDVLGIYRGDPRPEGFLGYLSGNAPEWDSGHGLLLHPGEYITATNGTGDTLTNGAQYTLNGEAIEAPAEQIYKLIGG